MRHNSHPFITAAEISLVRDRNEAPPGGPEKKVVGNAIDGVDGRKLKQNKKVSNGYKKKAWKLETNGEILGLEQSGEASAALLSVAIAVA